MVIPPAIQFTSLINFRLGPAQVESLRIIDNDELGTMHRTVKCAWFLYGDRCYLEIIIEVG